MDRDEQDTQITVTNRAHWLTLTRNRPPSPGGYTPDRPRLGDRVPIAQTDALIFSAGVTCEELRLIATDPSGKVGVPPRLEPLLCPPSPVTIDSSHRLPRVVKCQAKQ